MTGQHELLVTFYQLEVTEKQQSNSVEHQQQKQNLMITNIKHTNITVIVQIIAY